MKIVLVNYRYFFSGGPERYLFNIKELLENKGHEVIPFSIKSSRNVPVIVNGKERPELEEKYFLDIVDDEVYFAQSAKKKKSLNFANYQKNYLLMETKERKE